MDDAQEFPWNSNEDVWVMGSIGEDLLQKLKQCGLTSGSQSPSESHRTKLALEPASPNERKQRCQARPHCSCERYCPVIALPFTLFSREEFQSDFLTAAGEILAQADWSRQDAIPSDFIMDMVESTAVDDRPFAGVPCHIASYRLRAEKRSRVAAKDRGRGAVVRLDRIEFEVNQAVLPLLLRFCEEYRAVKSDQGFVLAARGEISPTSRLAAAAGAPPPRIFCRCGHAEVWHTRRSDLSFLTQETCVTRELSRPPPAPKRASTSASVQSTSLAPGVRRASASSLPSSASMPSLLPALEDIRADARISRGRLVLRDTGAKLMRASSSAGSWRAK